MNGTSIVSRPLAEQAPTLKGRASEENFYSLYEWALDPVLSLRELFRHLRETLDQLELYSPSSWQFAECKANLFVLTSAITCTIDDYLGGSAPNLSRVAKKIPKLRLLSAFGQRLLNALHYTFGFWQKRGVAQWRREWVASMDAACDFLVSANESANGQSVRHLRAAIEKNLRERSFPDALLQRRMQLPSGLRSQDLTHRDAISLADLFAKIHESEGSRLLIIGPRSMGAYFAPVVNARLRERGWKTEWLTLRPKGGISPWERRWLRGVRSPELRVLVVDESPNTGNTFALMLALLQGLGVPNDRIYLLAAMHPTRPDWCLPESDETRGVTLLRLEAHQLHKNDLLTPAAVRPLLLEYFRENDQKDFEVAQDEQTTVLNAHLAEHFRDGFQCRLKSVFDIRFREEDGRVTAKRVLAKSVGWGWLGYHAYFSGTRLAGFVPETFGLRNGILFSEWLEAADREPGPDCHRVPIDPLAQYVAARTKLLPLPEDPCFSISPGYGWTGWSVLLGTLRKAFGRYVGRFKVGALRSRIALLMTPHPTLIDGQMNPSDWIAKEDGLRKVDFEHHNFGRTELYVVDPAYDLACATFEFRLSNDQEMALIESYIRAGGDSTVQDRLLLWKLVIGQVVRGQAAVILPREQRPEVLDRWHRRLFEARNFLVHNMNSFVSSLLPAAPAKWTSRLFFMDLDGVFDSDIFDFPQTTTSGLRALSLLREHDYSVILNTARGLSDVRQYCRSFGFPGGIAESGCVFIDAVRQKEIPIIDAGSQQQMQRFLQIVVQQPGVFADPNYRYAMRLFRYSSDGTIAVSEQEIRRLFEMHGFDHLTAIVSNVDTTILPKTAGKGPALQWVKRYLGLDGNPVAAMGDNDQDAEMLRAAEIAFAPSNSSPIIRALVVDGHCRLTRDPFQRGLLEAAHQIIHPDGRTCSACNVRMARAKGFGSVVQDLLTVADRSRKRQLLSLVIREHLGA